jgi:hypothetical protein
MITNYVKENGSELTKESLNEINEMLYEDFILRNHEKIADIKVAKAIEENEAKWRERTGTNPPQSPEAGHRPPQQNLSDHEKHNEAQLSKLGI